MNKNQVYKCAQCGRETNNTETKHGSVCGKYVCLEHVTSRCSGFMVPKPPDDTRPCVPCVELGIFEMRNGLLTHPLRLSDLGSTYEYDDGSEFWFKTGHYAADNKAHHMDLVRLVYKAVPIDDYQQLIKSVYGLRHETRTENKS